MIERIAIQGIATYRNPVEVAPVKINYIYGSNGSGKTTLTNLITGDITSLESAITWRGDRALPIYAYNKRFVEKAFGASAQISGIFTLGEESKEAREFIEQKRLEIRKHDEEISGHERNVERLKQQSSNLDKEIDEICWTTFKKYADEFASALVGYKASKRKARDRILDAFAKLDHKEAITRETIKELYDKVYGDDSIVHDSYQPMTLEGIADRESCTFLEQPILGSSESPIGRFIEYLSNSDWIKEGQQYAEKAEGKCPYCQQELPSSIQADIEAFFDQTYEQAVQAVRDFSDEYGSFTTSLLRALEGLIKEPIPFLNYQSFISEVSSLATLIEGNRNTIQSKLASPSCKAPISSVRPHLQRINEIIIGFNNEIERNNQIVRNRQRERERCQKLIWMLFAGELSSAILRYKKDYDGSQKGLQEMGIKIDELTRHKRSCMRDIEEREATLTSVAPTVSRINDILARFGFEGFRLAENEKELGTYKIIRGDGSDARKTLSEGEHNFITFLYFYQLAYASNERKGISSDRVVIIDDPISSLDSNVLFIVTTLVRQILQDCRNGISVIRQVFILTHNVYFHKEITFLGSREKYAKGEAAYWVLRKLNNITQIDSYTDNPIQTSYELLWSELRDPSSQSRITVFNTMRRILEYYFNVIGGMEYEACINKFDGEEKTICKALISCINDGSHFITDDFVMCYEADALEKYIRVFGLIFDRMGHGSHYQMMMRMANDEDTVAEVAASI